MTAMVHDDELRTAAHDALGGPFTRLFSEVITRAIERGQALSSADSEAVSQVFPALAFHRGAALGLPVDEEFVVRVVDNLLMPLLSPDRTS